MFTGEKKIINLGRFEKGTGLYFMYQILDTSGFPNFQYLYKLYSDQNRPGIDEYIGDCFETRYGYRWSMAGRINPDTVIFGFDDNLNLSFAGIIVKLTGVYLLEYEKYKLPRVTMGPSTDTFSTQVTVSFDIPEIKNCKIVGVDTSCVSKDPNDCLNYYTNDNSDPFCGLQDGLGTCANFPSWMPVFTGMTLQMGTFLSDIISTFV
jgi:hypothetical protein